ncbi:MAG: phosphoglucomutase (alpha-D-glucose-1,6-bisphosphate-dependent) [Dokdonella sp.]|uniref:phosphoglucomutase (alpha-D-glucose-1,6-bisphosphate-dependent) n=1 Tax=Dokdonella sp. TaxID=2291710 RepID=UPI0025B86E8A|nr:phosphoglucomutase (alpha-D-glucose-1,6-bisphosphate-dependent) [Dokdonella sp.]MBZ0222978.1 phosphoglucomutase (alpha-D-glucose-1,6-bisphosphate-dependent) [Dokdonella sp.]
MASTLHPLAGKSATLAPLVDIDRLIASYHELRPDPAIAAQRVSFGTSGHRGSSLQRSFNEAHVLAIAQAICEYRAQVGIDGPLFLGIDTHALSSPAQDSVLEVLAAHGVEARIALADGYTPTPAVSHAILCWNRGRERGLADGIVVTPSHNPPEDGGIKYNPPNGGPADTAVTRVIQERANTLLADGLRQVRRLPLAQARSASTTREFDFLSSYVDDLGTLIDFDVIRSAALRLAVDPLGGAGVAYWPRIAERWRLDFDVVSNEVDPRFAFMSLDWDGRVRMDPSSPPAMQRLLALRDRYDVAMACDTDHDRHGIVTRSVGLLPANHYLAVMIDYLFRERGQWRSDAAIGKTVVSSAIIDRVAQRLGRRIFETPVGLKWFAAGLFDGSLGFGGEESAGAAFLRRDGGVWTTDKDGIAPGLLAAEICARRGRDPGECYLDLCAELGTPYFDRVDAAATREQKARLSALTPQQLTIGTLAGEPVTQVFDRAPGNDAAIGGIKVVAQSGWFAARPSGTEDIYKIYAESFRSQEHLTTILGEAQAVVDGVIAA